MRHNTLYMIAIALSVIASALVISLMAPGATASPAPAPNITGNKELQDRLGMYFREEFLSPGTSTTVQSPYFTRSFSGAGADAGAAVVPEGGRSSWGTAAMTPGTTATGYAYMRTNVALYFGYGDTWDVEFGIDSILAFANATDAYSLRIGFHDGLASNDVTDGVFFLYDSLGVSTGGGASNKWQCVTASNSSRTFYTTSYIVKNTPTKLRIKVMPGIVAADSAIFMIDDVVVRSQTTNIPSSSARATGLGIHMRNSAGTAAGRTIWYDYIMARCDYKEPK